MDFKESSFYTEKVGDLSSFASFLNAVHVLSLRDEVKDEKGHVLVQDGRPLRESTLKALANREGALAFRFRLENTKEFSDALNGKVASELSSRLHLAEFSFASYLASQNSINLTRLVSIAMKNEFFRAFIVLALFNQREIIEHLFEVALTSVGLFTSVRKDNYEYSQLANLFQAGILHDYSISQTASWADSEKFLKPDGHDGKSADQVSNKDLDQSIPEIIRNSNKLQANYSSNDKTALLAMSDEELMTCILNLVEYYTFIRRSVQEQVSDEMAHVLYQVSLQAEKGYFPSQLRIYFERFFSGYAEYFKYGQTIGKIENKCPHGPFALAYPKPKSVQVLCKNSNIPCEHRMTGKAIDIVATESEGASRFREALFPGFYDKCDFTNDLPAPPDKF